MSNTWNDIANILKSCLLSGNKTPTRTISIEYKDILVDEMSMCPVLGLDPPVKFEFKPILETTTSKGTDVIDVLSLDNRELKKQCIAAALLQLVKFITLISIASKKESFDIIDPLSTMFTSMVNTALLEFKVEDVDKVKLQSDIKRLLASYIDDSIIRQNTFTEGKIDA